MTDYKDFIEHKAVSALHTDSIQVDADDLNPMLYSFQRDIVRWALAKGRAAIFADCGLGKTPMQLEWADRIIRERERAWPLSWHLLPWRRKPSRRVTSSASV